jgi:hypothetical protein
MAASKGLRAIALADHDTVDGIEEAQNTATAEGVEVIPAVELSVSFQEYHDVHLLGYFIDFRDTAFLNMLDAFRSRRDARGKAIINRINGKLAAENRDPISLEEVLDGATGALGRPHIARVLIAHGHAVTTQDAFQRYLIPCDVPKLFIPIREALDEIHRIGGLAVLAHPTSITADRQVLSALLRELADMGLDGIEAYNNLGTVEDCQYLERVAHDLDLLVTGGSDFHGFENDIQMGTGRGTLNIPYRCIEELKRRKAPEEIAPSSRCS